MTQDGKTLFDELLAEEGLAAIQLLRGAIAEGGLERQCFELNRFSVTIDRSDDTVLIEDVLDPTEAGELRMSVSAFRAAVFG